MPRRTAREPRLPPADVLIYRLPGARVVIRPSGTEPKLKAYLEVVEPATPRTLAAARTAAAERLEPAARRRDGPRRGRREAGARLGGDRMASPRRWPA